MNVLIVHFTSRRALCLAPCHREAGTGPAGDAVSNDSPGRRDEGNYCWGKFYCRHDTGLGSVRQGR